MGLDKKTCFSNAGDFSGFVQAEHLDALKGAEIIEFDEKSTAIKSVQQFVPITEGHCFAYVCQWIKKIKSNKKYMVKSLDTLDSHDSQQAMAERFAASVLSNSLVLELEGIQTSAMNDLISYDSINVTNKLDTYARRGDNFAIIHQSGVKTSDGAGWGHVIALKLDRSTTGGLLNWSYPCAMFDPNIGQGMYKNHTDLATDLKALLSEYTRVVGGYTRLDVYLIQYTTGVD
jgi:hypothetical protein